MSMDLADIKRVRKSLSGNSKIDILPSSCLHRACPGVDRGLKSSYGHWIHKTN